MDIPFRTLKSRRCCVPNCLNKYSKMHRFPKNEPEIFDEWVQLIKPPNYECLNVLEIYNKYYVCHEHFSKDCFVEGTRRGLIRTAVPSINIPSMDPLSVDSDFKVHHQHFKPEDEATNTYLKNASLQSLNLNPNNEEVVPSVDDDFDDVRVKHCITCWAENSNNYFEITQKCYSGSLIKEVIILLVPGMESVLQEKDRVCNSCKNTLEACLRFIGQCILVQAQLKSDVLIETDEDVNDITADDPIECKDINIQIHAEEQHQNGSMQNDETLNNIDCEENSNGEELNECKESGIPNRVISVFKHDTEALVNTFDRNHITVCDQSDNSDNSSSRRIILVGSVLMDKCDTISSNEKEVKEVELHKFKRRPSSNSARIKKKPKVECDTISSNKKELKSPNFKRRTSSNSARINKKPNDKVAKYHCKDCSLTFYTNATFMNHLRKYHVKCDKCDLKFENKRNLTMHIRKFHIIRKPQSFLCDKCGKHFILKHKFTSHLTVHRTDRPYVCEICGALFKTKANAAIHKLTHGDRIFACNRCPKKFVSKINLKQHIRGVHIPEETNCRFQCDECGKFLKSAQTLAKHYRMLHSKSHVPQECTLCSKIFKSIFHLTRHLQRYHRDKQSKRKDMLPCEICGQFYKSLDSLKSHQKIHQRRFMKRKRWVCNDCGMTLKNSYSLRNHQRRHMNGGNFYRCNGCWKKFESVEELKQHVKIHNKPRYQCSQCDKYFRRKFLLDSHLLLDHTAPEYLQFSDRKVIDVTPQLVDENEEKVVIIPNETII